MFRSMQGTARYAVPALLTYALTAGAAAASPEADFLTRFEGNWSGSGSVQRKADEGAKTVKCDMVGDSSAAGVAIGGTCRAYLVFSRDFGAEISVDPATGRYSGVYRGSSIGPARLDGVREGDSVNLTITWPEEVNGDRTAQMRIVNEGAGNLRILVSDQMGAGGPVQTTTDLRLARR